MVGTLLANYINIMRDKRGESEMYKPQSIFDYWDIQKPPDDIRGQP